MKISSLLSPVAENILSAVIGVIGREVIAASHKERGLC